jgi:hypothetical protein
MGTVVVSIYLVLLHVKSNCLFQDWSNFSLQPYCSASGFLGLGKGYVVIACFVEKHVLFCCKVHVYFGMESTTWLYV